MSIEELSVGQQKVDEDKNEKEISVAELVKKFETAMSNRELKEAERVLHDEIGEKKGETWLDHRQRELQNFYYDEQDYEGVKRIIDKTKNPHSQIGRIKKFEAVTGTKYEREKQEHADKNIEKPEEVIDSKSFQNAIDAGEFEMAQEWLNEITNKGYKGLPKEEVEKIIRHRESELRIAKEGAENAK